MKKAYFYETPIGKIGIAEQGGSITNVFFGKTVVPEEYVVEETPVLKQAYTQLTEYFEGTRKEFDLPFYLEGTDFEKQVWAVLFTIPYGETRTYKQIAEQLGKPNACRAVGRANGLNPISLFYPCHRVIGSNGKLTGYAGGLDAKQYLLEKEGITQIFKAGGK